jgi:hypothetical protein
LYYSKENKYNSYPYIDDKGTQKQDDSTGRRKNRFARQDKIELLSRILALNMKV